MGTLSGGGSLRNSIGQRSLLGAKAGIGISLSDDCIFEAGLYVSAGTKVRLAGGEVVAGRELSRNFNARAASIGAAMTAPSVLEVALLGTARSVYTRIARLALHEKSIPLRR